MTNETTAADMIGDLVLANRILVDRGILDAFGHASVRDPKTSDVFHLARNKAPMLVTRDDILAFDLDAEPLTAGGERLYLERFIHSEIYRRRPDVGAVVHSHAASVLPFTMVRGVRLCPVCHMAGFVSSATPVFEIRDFAGDASDLLIRNQQLGQALANVLAEEPLVLMRGHGMTVVGATVRQAVFRAVYADSNARIQMDAMKLGDVTCLTDAEARAADLANSGQVDRAWTVWADEAAKRW